jgi:hypothetical protein
MKRLLIIIGFVGCLALTNTRAQEVGTSNLGEATNFPYAFNSGNYTGGRFHTGSSADDYFVTQVQLLLSSNNYGITDFNVSDVTPKF